jgi:predicted DNA-binding protein (MmcQ/YjbR family)
MNIELLQQYCLSKKGTTEDTPFGPETLVFRVMGKIFALTSLDTEECRVNLKCLPDYAIELRERHPDHIIPGYHMNKTHWNTVYTERGLEESLIRSLVDMSYNLIVRSLKKSEREALNQMG